MKQALLSLSLVAACTTFLMLGLNQPEEAFSQQPKQPFANAVQQRAEANALLKEIRDLLREQNALLQKSVSGAASPAGIR